MNEQRIENRFFEIARGWICDDYSASIRFIAGIEEGKYSIWKAAISIFPTPFDSDNSFEIKTNKIYVGRVDKVRVTRLELLQLVKHAVQGKIMLDGKELQLIEERELSYYSNLSDREKWHYELDLVIRNRHHQRISAIDLAAIDESLRVSNPPFDGLFDVSVWLGLEGAEKTHDESEIKLNVIAPVDLSFENCTLNNDTFHLYLHAHPKLDRGILKVAARGVPGENLATRLQVAEKVSWLQKDDSLQFGTASIAMANSDSVIVILVLNGVTVRRQWFHDPKKARNERLIAVQSFDANLKMIKRAIFEDSEQSKFESGISALLFLLGFSPCIQLETDSPDIIVQSGFGVLVLVECTIRTSDILTKLGKLVDRRGRLTKNLENSSHNNNIRTMLVCRSPKDQIAAHFDDFVSHNVILVDNEQLENILSQVRFQNSSDKILDELSALLKNANRSVFLNK